VPLQVNQASNHFNTTTQSDGRLFVSVQNGPDGLGALCVLEMEELINLNIKIKVILCRNRSDRRL